MQVRPTTESGAAVTLVGPSGRALPLTSRVLIASGCGGALPHGPVQRWLGGVAAWTSPTVTLSPRSRMGGCRVLESAAGAVYSTRWANEGTAATVHRLYMRRQASPLTVVVSFGAESPEAAAATALQLADLPRPAALELNLAWPGADPRDAESADAVSAWVGAVSDVIDLPLLVKLSPGPDILEASLAAAGAGADALVIGHGWPAVMQPLSAHGAAADLPSGYLAGPAVLPLTLRVVYDVAHRVPIGVIACGGVASVAGARAYLEAGAVAVQVGTAMFRNPATATDIATALAARPNSAAPIREARRH